MLVDRHWPNFADLVRTESGVSSTSGVYRGTVLNLTGRRSARAADRPSLVVVPRSFKGRSALQANRRAAPSPPDEDLAGGRRVLTVGQASVSGGRTSTPMGAANRPFPSCFRRRAAIPSFGVSCRPHAPFRRGLTDVWLPLGCPSSGTFSRPIAARTRALVPRFGKAEVGNHRGNGATAGHGCPSARRLEGQQYPLSKPPITTSSVAAVTTSRSSRTSGPPRLLALPARACGRFFRAADRFAPTSPTCLTGRAPMARQRGDRDPGRRSARAGRGDRPAVADREWC